MENTTGHEVRSVTKIEKGWPDKVNKAILNASTKQKEMEAAVRAFVEGSHQTGAQLRELSGAFEEAKRQVAEDSDGFKKELDEIRGSIEINSKDIAALSKKFDDFVEAHYKFHEEHSGIFSKLFGK